MRVRLLIIGLGVIAGYLASAAGQEPADVLSVHGKTVPIIRDAYNIAGHLQFNNEFDAMKVGGPGITDLKFSTEAMFLASTGEDRTVRTWQPSDGVMLDIYPEMRQVVQCVGISPDTRILARGGRLSYTEGATLFRSEGCVYLIDRYTSKEIALLTLEDGAATSVSFAPDGDFIVVGTSEGKCEIWRIKKHAWGVAVTRDAVLNHLGEDPGQVRKRLPAIYGLPNLDVTAVVSADCRTILTTNTTAPVALWDAEAKEEIARLPGKGPAALAADGASLAFYRDDITIELWSVERRERIGQLTHDRRALMQLIPIGQLDGGLAFSPDGKLLAQGHKRLVTIWDLENQQPIALLEAFSPLKDKSNYLALTHVAFSPDGKVLAAASSERPSIKAWNVQGALKIE